MNNRPVSPFEAYVAPARAKASLWHTALGICLIGLIYAVLLVFFVNATASMWVIDTPTASGTLILLLSFGCMALAVVLVTQYLHKRGPGTLFGPQALVKRGFVAATLAVVAINAVTLVFWSMDFDADRHLAAPTWIALLPFSLVGVALQTGAEELVFRGYLQQQLAARFRSPLIWMILPSVLFGLMHYDPGVSGENTWWIVLATGMFGLAAADLTARTGSLGAAWGLHFANNVAALLILATKGSLPGLALYVTPYHVSDPTVGSLIGLELLALFVIWLLARLLLRV